MKPIYGFLATMALLLVYCGAYSVVQGLKRRIAPVDAETRRAAAEAIKQCEAGADCGTIDQPPAKVSVTLRCYDGNGKPIPISDLKAADATTATFSIAEPITDTGCFTSPVGLTLKSCEKGADCSVVDLRMGGFALRRNAASANSLIEIPSDATFGHVDIAPCHKEGDLTVCAYGGGGGSGGPGFAQGGNDGSKSKLVPLPGYYNAGPGWGNFIGPIMVPNTDCLPKPCKNGENCPAQDWIIPGHPRPSIPCGDAPAKKYSELPKGLAPGAKVVCSDCTDSCTKGKLSDDPPTCIWDGNQWIDVPKPAKKGK